MESSLVSIVVICFEVVFWSLEGGMSCIMSQLLVLNLVGDHSIPEWEVGIKVGWALRKCVCILGKTS